VSLWDWAIEAYARRGVEELCLTLQDEHGQCLGYLLWAAWAARDGHRIDPSGLVQAAALARDWEMAVLRPLRSVRRALKQPTPGMEAVSRDGLRDRIKAEELAAERLPLEAGTPIVGGEPLDLEPALRDAAAVWGPPPPRVLLEALSGAFSAA
jgi:uncharacterized protein (TIGR02444 family)